MTGVTMVTSDKSLSTVRELFIEEHLTGSINQAKKQAWTNLCTCKAAIEVVKGDRKKKQAIYADMAEKYARWAALIASNDIGLAFTPDYVTKQMLMTKDMKNQRPLEVGIDGGKKLWDKWLRIKREVTGSDNIAIKAAITRMPGGALPSGTDLELFLVRMMYEVYDRKKTKRGCDDVGDNIGGSSAKAAGYNAHMDEKEDKANANDDNAKVAEENTDDFANKNVDANAADKNADTAVDDANPEHTDADSANADDENNPVVSDDEARGTEKKNMI